MSTALVWGATGGLGNALTRLLIEEDWNVVAAGRKVDRLRSTPYSVLEADISDEFSVRRAAMELSQKVDEIALFIYAVGDISAVDIGATEYASWTRTINANLSGAFLTTHHCLPLLASGAPLIYIGAIHERLRLPRFAAYAAAKAGLDAFATTLAKEERSHPVLVVRPGAIDTPFWDEVPMRLPKSAATPDEVAAAILAAVSDGKTGILDL